MNGDQKFLATAFVVAGMVMATLITAVTACNINANEKVARMVEAGASPIDAACALSTASSTGCQTLIMRGGT